MSDKDNSVGCHFGPEIRSMGGSNDREEQMDGKTFLWMNRWMKSKDGQSKNMHRLFI